jgi:hypothetical protein
VGKLTERARRAKHRVNPCVQASPAPNRESGERTRSGETSALYRVAPCTRSGSGCRGGSVVLRTAKDTTVFQVRPPKRRATASPQKGGPPAYRRQYAVLLLPVPRPTKAR